MKMMRMEMMKRRKRRNKYKCRKKKNCTKKIEVTAEEVAENSTIREVEIAQEPVVEEEVEVCDVEDREIIEINGNSEVNQEKLEVEDEGDDSGINVNEEDETFLNTTSPEAALDLQKIEHEEVQLEGEEKPEEKGTNEKNDNEETSFELALSSAVSEASSDSENNEADATTAEMAETENSAESAEESTEEEKETAARPWDDEEAVTRDRSESDSHDPNLHVGPESKDRENIPLKKEEKGSVLPECLLLMMCEPKLSMEVSKETWVCSTDFVRWQPERPAKKKDGGVEPKRISNESKPPPPPPQLPQPPRSSCSFPVASGGGMSMASMIEEKLVSSNGYEPFVLTRCKSEPMRSSAKSKAGMKELNGATGRLPTAIACL